MNCYIVMVETGTCRTCKNAACGNVRNHAEYECKIEDTPAYKSAQDSLGNLAGEMGGSVCCPLWEPMDEAEAEDEAEDVDIPMEYPAPAASLLEAHNAWRAAEHDLQKLALSSPYRKA